MGSGPGTCLVPVGCVPRSALVAASRGETAWTPELTLPVLNLSALSSPQCCFVGGRLATLLSGAQSPLSTALPVRGDKATGCWRGGCFTEQVGRTLAELNRSQSRTFSRLASVGAEPGGAISAQGCNRMWGGGGRKRKATFAGFVADSGRFSSQRFQTRSQEKPSLR